jgi:hypothetical protein
MFGDRRRLLMSGGALAVLVLAIWSLWPSSPAPSASAPPPAARGAEQSSGAAPAVPPVKIDQLSAERQPPSDTPRNPFRYQPKAPPPPPPTPKPVGVAPSGNVSTEPARPLPPPGPPPIPLKFLGILTRANGVQWAVLTEGKGPIYGREGDIIDGRYRIVKIGTESIELTYVDGRGRQVVRLTGQ